MSRRRPKLAHEISFPLLRLRPPNPSPNPSPNPIQVDIICKLEKLNFRYSSMLAMLRALRPLAALQILPSMKIVLTGLSRAVLGLSTMAVIVLFFFVWQ